MEKYLPVFKNKKAQNKYNDLYEACLKMWPVPYEIKNVNTEHGNTHVLVCGSDKGKPLILMHGACATLLMWYPNINTLTKYFKIYAIDTIGDVNRSKPIKPFRNKKEAFDWLNKVLDNLYLKKVYIVGMSYGTFLGLNLAVNVPDRIEKLILISPAEVFVPLKFIFLLKFIKLILIPTKKVRMNFLKWSNGNNEIEENDFTEMIFLAMKYGIFRIPSSKTIFKEFELKGFNIPVLVLVGENEVIVDVNKLINRAKKVIKNINVKVIKNASHTLSTEQPDIVNKEILKFINNK